VKKTRETSNWENLYPFYLWYQCLNPIRMGSWYQLSRHTDLVNHRVWYWCHV